MDAFAKAIVGYYRERGRKALPWQHPRTPYRVWVSEIMLQQTQVERVIDYFNRFVSNFPDVSGLAAAELDEVLAHWSGLGYYARARNLHASARLMLERHNGELPDDLESLLSLPGIGKSTAGAILSSAFGIPAPILDGNVRRVLARFHEVKGATGDSATEKELWRLAEIHTPRDGIREYTQGIMDFGARLCRKSRPACPECPLADDCRALASRSVSMLPVPRRRRARPLRRVRFFLVTDHQGRVLLESRPSGGIWGGLWTLPERDLAEDKREFIGQFDTNSGHGPSVEELPPPSVFRHHFTHFELEVHPVRLVINRFSDAGSEVRRWVTKEECEGLGIPSATKRLLAHL